VEEGGEKKKERNQRRKKRLKGGKQPRFSERQRGHSEDERPL
jgi:hypothetical protein